MKHLLINLLIAVCAAIPAAAGRRVTLTLDRAVSLAADSSLTALRDRSVRDAGYWEWRSYRAGRLPGVTLNLIPAQYYHYITSRYDSEQNIDVYRNQQMYSATGTVRVEQNLDMLGGSLYLESGLGYMRNFGALTYDQFSSVPVRLGYSQSLLGYNEFGWLRRIEPLKYEKVKRQYLYNTVALAEQVADAFFDLLLAQTERRLAEENRASADTLCVVGQRRFDIASISQAELLTLQLDRVNAHNAVENAEIGVKRAQFVLATLLGIETDTDIEVVVPSRPMVGEICAAEAVEHARANSPALLARRQSVLEAQRAVSRARIESMFNASLNLSVGFNQVGSSLASAYSHPLRQDLVSLSLSVPIVDWGVRRGRLNMAANALSVAEIESQQEELSLEQDVTLTVADFASRSHLTQGAVEALDLADMVYAQTTRRFVIGKTDVNALTLAHMRRQEASKNYVAALRNFWLSYYKIRRLTLYDFELRMPVEAVVDAHLR